LAERFNPKDLKEYKNFLDMQEEIASKMRESSTKFLSASVEIVKRTKELRDLESQIVKLKQEEETLNQQITNATGEELENLRKQKAQLKENQKYLQGLVRENKAMVTAFRNQTGSLKNISIALSRDVWGGVKKVGGGLKRISAELRTQFLSYSEQDGQIRRISTNLGILGKQQYALRKTLYQSALATQRWGASAGEVAQMYESYVESTGRLIPLSEESAKSLALMAKGTALGSEGSAQMASNMETFGMSIQSTTKYVEDVSNMSEKMGVSSSVVLKTLNQNLKKAQSLNFKDGVKGIAKMAALSTKLKMDMGEIMGFAETLYEPEGAIEAAAALQMMGGAFSQMGDPLKLMYQGRNNPEQLTKDLANAASASVEFNRASGEFKIPAMELQRLKQVSEATGVSMESLTESALTVAKQKKIGSILSPNVSGEYKEFVESLGQFNAKNGKFEITVGNDVYDVSKLNQSTIKSLMGQDTALKARAEEAQSSMERFKNMLESLKNIAYLFFGGIEKSLRDPLEILMGGGEGTIQDFGRKATELGETVGKWIADMIPLIPIFVDAVKNIGKKISEFFQSETWSTMKSVGEAFLKAGKLMWDALTMINKTLGPTGILGAILLVRFPKILTGAFSMLKGLTGGLSNLFGRTRGSSPANPMFVSMAGGTGGATDMLGGLTGGKSTFMRRGLLKAFGKGGASKILGLAGNLGKGFKIANPLMWASMGLDVGRGFLGDQNSGLGKTLGVGSTMAGDAATGALLGSVIPGVGNVVGGILGGVVGLGRGLYNEFKDDVSKEYKVPKNIGMGASYGGMALDGALMPDGNFIKTGKGKYYSLSPKDVAVVGQPGAGDNGGGGTNNINVTGTIKLEGIEDNLLNKMSPREKNELARMVIAKMNNQNR
jgi:predicted heme/steroid binding protein